LTHCSVTQKRRKRRFDHGRGQSRAEFPYKPSAELQSDKILRYPTKIDRKHREIELFQKRLVLSRQLSNKQAEII